MCNYVARRFWFLLVMYALNRSKQEMGQNLANTTHPMNRNIEFLLPYSTFNQVNVNQVTLRITLFEVHQQNRPLWSPVGDDHSSRKIFLSRELASFAGSQPPKEPIFLACMTSHVGINLSCIGKIQCRGWSPVIQQAHRRQHFAGFFMRGLSTSALW